MMHRRLLISALFVLCIGSGAIAQQADKGEVTATGQATIKAQPETLRITIAVVGEGKDVRDALKSLSTETESVRTKLAALGAEADSIQVSDPAMGEGAGDARALAIAMMRHGGERTPAAPVAGKVKVGATLEARLPLKATAPQDRLVEAVELMDKAKAAFARKLTAEEQEIMEEMQGRESNLPRPGEPQFLFVHVVTEQERAKATADALAQAKASATRLAEASGKKLGDIRSLSESASSGSAGGNEDYSPYYYARAMSMAGATGASAQNEAVASQYGPVTFAVTVSVRYALD
jgi:uncharacterized protein YggE